MLSNLGNILLITNVILSFTTIYYAFQCLKSSDETIFKKILSNLFSSNPHNFLACFFTLVAGFIVSDFSLINVYQNSHTTKPLFYKISGTWGNHEGSLMLWIIILSIFSFLFLFYNENHIQKNFIVYIL